MSNIYTKMSRPRKYLNAIIWIVLYFIITPIGLVVNILTVNIAGLAICAFVMLFGYSEVHDELTKIFENHE